jgi:hypothetical protein
MQTQNMHDEQIAKALAGDTLLAFRRLADGGMVIVAANGMKLHFSAEKVREAEARLRADGDGHPHSLGTSNLGAMKHRP